MLRDLPRPDFRLVGVQSHSVRCPLAGCGLTCARAGCVRGGYYVNRRFLRGEALVAVARMPNKVEHLVQLDHSCFGIVAIQRIVNLIVFCT